MSKYIDFTLKKRDRVTNTDLIFRIYPDSCHCYVFDYKEDQYHYFSDDVYKVYLSWAILKREYDEDDNIIPEATEFMFRGGLWDECSLIADESFTDSLDDLLYTSRNRFEMRPCGEGAEWIVEKLYTQAESEDIFEDSILWERVFRFILVNEQTGNAFVFYLPEEHLIEFMNFICEFNRYLLNHCEPMELA